MLMSDLWSFDLGTASWRKLGGSTVGNARGSVVAPGSRRGASAWRLSDGSVLLFGGFGLSTVGVRGELSDLWRLQGGSWSYLGTSEGQLSYVPVNEASTPSWPGGRRGAQAFVDENDSVYLWGGFGVGSAPGQSGQLGDLWRYRASNNRWELVVGPREVNAAGVYGTQGVAAASNLPPPRSDAAAWTANGKLYLFGGFGAEGFFNDVWVFDGGLWTWIAGQRGPGQPGVPDSVPSNRYGATAQVSGDGASVLLFGGYSSTGPGLFNELWRFDMALRTFALVGGRSGPNWTSNGCRRGLPSPGVVPGGRTRACSWRVPSSGEFVVFGGHGLAAEAPVGYLDDLYSLKTFPAEPTDLCSGHASVQLALDATTVPAASLSTTTVIIIATVICGVVVASAVVAVLLMYRFLRQRQMFPRQVVSSNPMSPSSPTSPSSPQHLIVNQMSESAVDLRSLRSAVSPRRTLDFDALE